MARTITPRRRLRALDVGPRRGLGYRRIEAGLRHRFRRAAPVVVVVGWGRQRVDKPDDGWSRGVPFVPRILLLGQRQGKLKAQDVPVQMNDEPAKNAGRGLHASG